MKNDSGTVAAKIRRTFLGEDLFKWAYGAALISSFWLGASVAPGRDPAGLPHLRRQGTATQLVVDGKPFLILGGELGNSSASDPAYLDSLWPTLTALNLNTVLAPVYWELLEPEEGRFDFTLVDALVEDARAHNVRLVLLWFGSWKNSMSCYAPGWVKTDQDRFPRARDRDGRAMEILSPLSTSNRDADARAFTALMTRLRDIDGDRHTVIMIQVENEIGMIPEARDYRAAAEAAFAADVPSELTAHLLGHRKILSVELQEVWRARGHRTAGSWQDVFGIGLHTEELFSAWQFARYVEYVAASGKAVYPLPMFVNAALVRPGHRPGQYPSGGPLPHLLEVWRAGAPSIDFLAPDIYFPNFVEWAKAYDQPGNPLFIPEAGRVGMPETAARAFYTMGQHHALGFSPFSIESISDAASNPLAAAYDVLAQIAPVITEHQGKDSMAGLCPVVAYDGTVDAAPREVGLGDYVFTVTFVDPWIPVADQDVSAHGGLIVALDDDTFLVAGAGITCTFSTVGSPRVRAGIASIEEGRYRSGVWVPGRRLNGDQSHQGRHLRLPPGPAGIQVLRLYRYE